MVSLIKKVTCVFMFLFIVQVGYSEKMPVSFQYKVNYFYPEFVDTHSLRLNFCHIDDSEKFHGKCYTVSLDVNYIPGYPTINKLYSKDFYSVRDIKEPHEAGTKLTGLNNSVDVKVQGYTFSFAYKQPQKMPSNFKEKINQSYVKMIGNHTIRLYFCDIEDHKTSRGKCYFSNFNVNNLKQVPENNNISHEDIFYVISLDDLDDKQNSTAVMPSNNNINISGNDFDLNFIFRDGIQNQHKVINGSREGDKVINDPISFKENSQIYYKYLGEKTVNDKSSPSYGFKEESYKFYFCSRDNYCISPPTTYDYNVSETANSGCMNFNGIKAIAVKTDISKLTHLNKTIQKKVFKQTITSNNFSDYWLVSKSKIAELPGIVLLKQEDKNDSIVITTKQNDYYSSKYVLSLSCQNKR